MSLNAKILSLLSGIVGVEDRTGIASSIFYICDLYLDGRINEDQARTEIYNICYTIISYKHPHLLDEEKRVYANRTTDEIMNAVKVEGIRRLTSTRFRARGRPIFM